ncbi:MAG: hypothetical protein WCX16_05525, partial [Candidatus Omnitrophota bacterium]
MKLKAVLFLLFIGLMNTSAFCQEGVRGVVHGVSGRVVAPRGGLELQPLDVPDCTGGQVWENNQCVCRNNFYWNERMSQCRPVRTCPPGEHFDRERDNCLSDCTGGQVWENNQCVCRNNFYWNERMSQCRPVRTCPPGEHFDRERDNCLSDCTGG